MRLPFMELRRILAENVRRLRASRGMSQEDVAELAKIDRTYISSIERQTSSATIDVLERLAKAFDVKPSTLLEQA